MSPIRLQAVTMRAFKVDEHRQSSFSAASDRYTPIVGKFPSTLNIEDRRRAYTASASNDRDDDGFR
ncbi:MAG TPA: hypothetical protein DCY79_06300 [Planctomycetaceae bacterium]|nr:hypothetical protein [Planctomycetaceae bacterium]